MFLLKNETHGNPTVATLFSSTTKLREYADDELLEL